MNINNHPLPGKTTEDFGIQIPDAENEILSEILKQQPKIHNEIQNSDLQKNQNNQPKKQLNSAGEGEKADFITEFLDHHNKLRKMHGSPPLKISCELNKSAQLWAENQFQHKIFKHSVAGYTRKPGTGENLEQIQVSNYKVSAKDVVDNWYRQNNDYDYSDLESVILNKFMRRKPIVDKFTQVVWKDTKYVGVGYVFRDGLSVIVAHYEPAGNQFGCFNENVKPPKTE